MCGKGRDEQDHWNNGFKSLSCVKAGCLQLGFEIGVEMQNSDGKGCPERLWDRLVWGL